MIQIQNISIQQIKKKSLLFSYIRLYSTRLMNYNPYDYLKLTFSPDNSQKKQNLNNKKDNIDINTILNQWQGQQFIDKMFQHNYQNIYDSQTKLQYMEQVIWMPVEQLHHKFLYVNLKQSLLLKQLEEWQFVSSKINQALIILKQFIPNKFKDLLTQKKPKVQKPLKYLYSFSIFLNKQNQTQYIDSYIPVSQTRNQELFSKIHNGQIFPCLLQKLLAKICKGYQNINKMELSQILELFSGYLEENIKVKSLFRVEQKENSKKIQRVSKFIDYHIVKRQNLILFKTKNNKKLLMFGLKPNSQYLIVKKFHINQSKQIPQSPQLIQFLQFPQFNPQKNQQTNPPQQQLKWIGKFSKYRLQGTVLMNDKQKQLQNHSSDLQNYQNFMSIKDLVQVSKYFYILHNTQNCLFNTNKYKLNPKLFSYSQSTTNNYNKTITIKPQQNPNTNRQQSTPNINKYTFFSTKKYLQLQINNSNTNNTKLLLNFRLKYKQFLLLQRKSKNQNQLFNSQSSLSQKQKLSSNLQQQDQQNQQKNNLISHPNIQIQQIVIIIMQKNATYNNNNQSQQQQQQNFYNNNNKSKILYLKIWKKDDHKNDLKWIKKQSHYGANNNFKSKNNQQQGQQSLKDFYYYDFVIQIDKYIKNKNKNNTINLIFLIDGQIYNISQQTLTHHDNNKNNKIFDRQQLKQNINLNLQITTIQSQFFKNKQLNLNQMITKSNNNNQIKLSQILQQQQNHILLSNLLKQFLLFQQFKFQQYQQLYVHQHQHLQQHEHFNKNQHEHSNKNQHFLYQNHQINNSNNSNNDNHIQIISKQFIQHLQLAVIFIKYNNNKTNQQSSKNNLDNNKKYNSSSSLVSSSSRLQLQQQQQQINIKIELNHQVLNRNGIFLDQILCRKQSYCINNNNHYYYYNKNKASKQSYEISLSKSNNYQTIIIFKVFKQKIYSNDYHTNKSNQNKHEDNIKFNYEKQRYLQMEDKQLENNKEQFKLKSSQFQFPPENAITISRIYKAII